MHYLILLQIYYITFNRDLKLAFPILRNHKMKLVGLINYHCIHRTIKYPYSQKRMPSYKIFQEASFSL